MTNKTNEPNAEIVLDDKENLLAYKWHLPFCSHPENSTNNLSEFLLNKSTHDILELSLSRILDQNKQLTLTEEEIFVYQNELSILKSVLAKYLASEREDLDSERCDIVQISHEGDHITLQALIWPPQTDS